jgi:hypothetical protein
MSAEEVSETIHQRPRTPSSRPAKELVPYYPSSTPSESPQADFSTRPESSETVQNYFALPMKQLPSSSAAEAGIEEVSAEIEIGESGLVDGKEMFKNDSRRCRISSEEPFEVVVGVKDEVYRG